MADVRPAAAEPARRDGSREQDEIEAVVAATAPAILRFLGDGVPRSKRAIVRALADIHPKPDLTRTLMRLAVTGRLRCDAEQRYLPPHEADRVSFRELASHEE